MAEKPTQPEQQQEPDRDFAEDLDVEQQEADSVQGGAKKRYDDESPKE
jgi:hypothetical protein